jgi:hypothetical protein
MADKFGGGVVGPCLGSEVADVLHRGGKDLEGNHAAAQGGQAEAGEQGNAHGLLLVAQQGPEEDARAGGDEHR